MNIVITDGYALNPGDLNWDKISTLGNITYYDRSQPAELAERCSDADVIICNKSLITRAVIGAAAHLQLITVAATGYNCVETVAAKERNIRVCNVPEYGTYSVAQHTIALLLELSNRVGLHAETVRRGEWVNATDWCYSRTPIIELYGKTLGIVGYGRIGKQVGVIAKALGMEVIYYSYHKSTGKYSGIDLPELFKQSDMVSLHCPLTDKNKELINRETLKLMKPTAFLINTSRGQLVNEDDLYNALSNGTIAGAALDVLSVEPPVKYSPLFDLPNCIVTPHNAWISFEARQRIMETTFQNIKQALAGEPVNVVV